MKIIKLYVKECGGKFGCTGSLIYEEMSHFWFPIQHGSHLDIATILTTSENLNKEKYQKCFFDLLEKEDHKANCHPKSGETERKTQKFKNYWHRDLQGNQYQHRKI